MASSAVASAAVKKCPLVNPVDVIGPRPESSTDTPSIEVVLMLTGGGTLELPDCGLAREIAPGPAALAAMGGVCVGERDESIGVASTFRLIAALTAAGLIEEAAPLAEQEISRATRVVYEGDVAACAAWLEKQGLPPLPQPKPRRPN